MNKERVIDFRYAPDASQVCIGLVDDRYKTLVWDDGSLCFTYEAEYDPYYYFRLEHNIQSRILQNRGFRYRFRPYILHKDTLTQQKQDFGDAHEAIVKTVQSYENSTASWTCFAWQKDEDTRIDVILWELKADKDFITTRSGIVLQILGDEPVKEKIFSTQRLATHLEPNKEMKGAFFIVHCGSFSQQDATLENAQKAHTWCKDYWNGIKPFKSGFTVPDKQIMDMLEACGRNILQAREIKENVPTYQVGPTIYRGLWIVDGLFFLDAVHIMGRSQEAYDGMLAVLRHVHPDGSISAISFHEKECAIAIYTFVRQCQLMGDDERFCELWPTILRGFKFIQNRVSESKNLGVNYPAFGLYPPSYGDGGINGLEPEYTTPLWIMTGIKAASEMGKRLALTGFEEMQNMIVDMMKWYRKAYERDRKITDDGIHYVPISMLTEVEYKEHLLNAEYFNKTGEICNLGGYTPQCGTWALAHSIAPGELFAPDDIVVTDFMELLESCDKAEGIPQDTGWMTENAVWSYSSMFYAQVFLYAGKGEKSADYLYSFANHACPGRCWREEQALRNTNSNAIWGDMPHNWGAAEFIRLVRNMIILEKGDTLELLVALPDEWLPKDNCDLFVENSPTKFGSVTVRLCKTEDNDFRLTYNIIGNRLPKEIKVRGKIIENLPSGEMII